MSGRLKYRVYLIFNADSMEGLADKSPGIESALDDDDYSKTIYESAAEILT